MHIGNPKTVQIFFFSIVEHIRAVLKKGYIFSCRTTMPPPPPPKSLVVTWNLLNLVLNDWIVILTKQAFQEVCKFPFKILCYNVLEALLVVGVQFVFCKIEKDWKIR